MMSMTRRVLAGEKIHRSVGNMDMEAYRAAAGRVMDVRAQWEELLAATAASDIHAVEDRRFTADLPLVSPPRVGITGWWQLSDKLAALVVSTEDPDVHEVWPLVARGDGALLFTGVNADLHADGTVWSSQTWACLPPHPDDEYTVKMANTMLRVILLASTLAQADPEIVETKTVPPRGRSRKGKTVSPRSHTTLKLPGLRYDAKRGRFSSVSPTGVAWHMVRGHWRELRSPRFTQKSGERVWVKPHTRGSLANGQSSRGYALS